MKPSLLLKYKLCKSWLAWEKWNRKTGRGRKVRKRGGEKSSTKLVEARKNSMLNPKANEDGGR
jgi:hypothetical protein